MANDKLLMLDLTISKTDNTIKEIEQKIEATNLEYINNGGYVLEMRQAKNIL